MKNKIERSGGAGRRPRNDTGQSGVPQSWLVSSVLGATIVIALLVLQVTGLLDLLGDDIGREAVHWMAVVAGILVVTVAFAWERQMG